MRGDFILECIIQLEGGVKKWCAVKVPIAGKLTRWLQDKRGKIKREGRAKGGKRWMKRWRRSPQCELQKSVKSWPA